MRPCSCAERGPSPRLRVHLAAVHALHAPPAPCSTGTSLQPVAAVRGCGLRSAVRACCVLTCCVLGTSRWAFGVQGRQGAEPAGRPLHDHARHHDPARRPCAAPGGARGERAMAAARPPRPQAPRRCPAQRAHRAARVRPRRLPPNPLSAAIVRRMPRSIQHIGAPREFRSSRTMPKRASERDKRMARRLARQHMVGCRPSMVTDRQAPAAQAEA